MYFVREGHEIAFRNREAVEKIPTNERARLEYLAGEINGVLPGATKKLLLSPGARVRIALLAAILLILSIAGSIGEAAYQLKVAKDTEAKAAQNETANG